MDATQVQPLRLGTRLEGFEVSRVTDHDPGGYTYVGHEVASKKPVVIREYPPGVAQDLAALAKSRHANLAVVLRTFEANNRAYLITEPIAGEALSDLLHRENTAFDEARLKGILLPLADGLEAAHVAGVLHLDIQPDHIVIKPNGAPVLVGFGGGDRRTRNPGYSAIEQYSEEFRVGRWTDIYAIGAVAYRLISGQAVPPADQRHAKDEMKAAREVGANKYHRSLLQAIDWALKVNPLERPQNLAQWKDALLGLSETSVGGAGAGATVPITATMVRKFSELRQKKPPPARKAKANKTPVPPASAAAPPSLVADELRKEQLAREEAERERLERERAERARLEVERLERERAQREQAERERLEHERAQRERAEQERLEREKAEREKAEREKTDREKAEREKTDREKAEREKAEHERAERELAELRRLQRERAAEERAERERVERETAERARTERERAERDRAEHERAEREGAERERAEHKRAERERAERERAERERADQEREDRERRERAERERATARRPAPASQVPVVTIPPRISSKPRPPAPPPPSAGPSWLSAIAAVLVLVLTIGYWWYNDTRQHRERTAAEPLERVAPANPPAPRSAVDSEKPRPKPPVEKVEAPPPERVSVPEVVPEKPKVAQSEPSPEAASADEPEAPPPAAPEPPKAASKTAKPGTLEAPAGASGQKQLASQLRKKLSGTWSEESAYSVMAGDGCYAKISRSWTINFGGTAEEGRALTGTFQTKVRAQSAERRECRQFDDQIKVDGALTARPVSGNTLQVELVPTTCSGDCEQIADVFNYRNLERRYRFNVSADGYLSFSEEEVDFELKGPRR